MTIYEKLVDVQGRLKAPKNQRNNFGKYNYRSCEDILEAVKPLLVEHKLALTISDYVDTTQAPMVSATAKITDGKDTIEVSAQAGIDINRKGMDIAQSFGSSSSYARKYALNGLFLIDDTKDSDATNTHGKTAANAVNEALAWLPDSGDKFNNAKSALQSGKVSIQDIRKKYKVSKKVEQLLND
jgi:hypothetical protein|tara:strand:+ start:1935 stop:2486 length:552 start_codon:yes stop_codon:yes gene_type:complete